MNEMREKTIMERATRIAELRLAHIWNELSAKEKKEIITKQAEMLTNFKVRARNKALKKKMIKPESPKYCLMCSSPLEMNVEKTQVTETTFKDGKEVTKKRPQKRVEFNCAKESCQWSYEVEYSEANDQLVHMWR